MHFNPFTLEAPKILVVPYCTPAEIFAFKLTLHLAGWGLEVEGNVKRERKVNGKKRKIVILSYKLFILLLTGEHLEYDGEVYSYSGYHIR